MLGAASGTVSLGKVHLPAKIAQAVQEMEEIFGAGDLAIGLVADLLLGIVKLSIPKFPGRVILRTSLFTMQILMEYPRVPCEIPSGGKTVELSVGVLVPNQKRFLRSGSLADRHYERFNEAICSLAKFFKSNGWTVEK